MRLDQEMKTLFIEAYQAKLACAKIYAEMYFTMNLANTKDGEWAKYQYRELRDIRLPTQSLIFQAALTKLTHRATECGLGEAEVLMAFNDGVKNAAEHYGDFLKWRLTNDDNSKWSEMNARFRNSTVYDSGMDTQKDKVALETMETNIQVYIQSRTANRDDYFGCMDKFFGGHDRAVKLSAANKIHDYNPESLETLKLTQEELDALNQGSLFGVVKEKLLTINDRIEIIPTPGKGKCTRGGFMEMTYEDGTVETIIEEDNNTVSRYIQTSV